MSLNVDTSRVRVTGRRLLPEDQTGYRKHEYNWVVVLLTEGELAIEDAGGNATTTVTTVCDADGRPEGVEHNVLNLSDQEIRFTDIELLGS